MNRYAFIFLLLLSGFAQAQLFENPKYQRLARKGIDYVYNAEPELAKIYIDSLEKLLPKHPAVPLMKAMNILWSNIPLVTLDTVFAQFTGHLMRAAELAEGLDGGTETDPEAIFFEMAARGILAEYYADMGYYMKAFNEAQKAYGLIKKGFDLTDQIPDFLLTSGVYNYFREKYPERNPVYKPLVWFFRSGDKALGIAQLKQATEKAVLTKVESYIYLSYVYLRYEYEPRSAQRYLKELMALYPRNQYIQVKYLESITPPGDFERLAPYALIAELAKSDRPYYKMSGESFMGLYAERIKKDPERASRHYRRAILAGKEVPGHGEYYRAMAHLGLGRILAASGDHAQARYHLERAVAEADTEDIVKEAQERLKQLP